MDVQAAAYLPEPFPHPSHPTTPGACPAHPNFLFRRYTIAAILDLYANLTVRSSNANPGCRASRMAMNIRETLLHGPENRRLGLAIEPPKIRGNLQIHFDLATLGESLCVPTESRSKSGFVQQRRMEQVGDRADLLAEFSYQSRTIVNRIGGLREALDVGSHRSKIHS